LEKVRVDQESRVQGLANASVENRRKAELIEYNHEAVDTVIATLQAALGTGMAWDELWRVVRLNKKNGDPIAQLIHSLDLEKNQASNQSMSCSRFGVCVLFFCLFLLV
jgi:hypothetical protein